MHVLRRLNWKVITACALIYVPTMMHNSGFNGADTPAILTGTAHNASRYAGQRVCEDGCAHLGGYFHGDTKYVAEKSIGSRGINSVVCCCHLF